MPPLAKNKLDAEAVALIRDWILSSEPLPVELVQFTGAYSQGSVRLAWTTASETNNAGFSVERRLQYEAREPDGDWAQIDFVEGQGSTQAATSYSYLDTKIPSMALEVQYRLKQIDFDGAFEYSDVLSIPVASTDVMALYKNYPNPFNPSTTISYALPVSGHVNLTVYDMQGRAVRVLVNAQRAAGRHEVTFNAGGLASGLYLYRLNTGGQTLTKQMLLVK